MVKGAAGCNVCMLDANGRRLTYFVKHKNVGSNEP